MDFTVTVIVPSSCTPKSLHIETFIAHRYTSRESAGQWQDCEVPGLVAKRFNCYWSTTVHVWRLWLKAANNKINRVPWTLWICLTNVKYHGVQPKHFASQSFTITPMQTTVYIMRNVNTVPDRPYLGNNSALFEQYNNNSMCISTT